MSKRILAVLTITAASMLASGANTAQAAPRHHQSGSHWYIGVGLGNGQSRSTSTDNYDFASTTSSTDGFALRLSGGWRYVDRRGDAIGIGLTDTGVSLGDSTGAGILGLDLNGKVHLAGAWFVSGRIGTYSGRRVVLENDTYYYSDTQTGAFYGIGTGIDINRHSALAVTWDRYQVNDFTDDSDEGPVRVSDARLDVVLLSYTYTF